MALVATYGDISAYNIKVYDMAGGGYYAILCDGATEIFKRRNSAGGQDTILTVPPSSSTNFLDHFLSYSYDSGTNTLTLSGAVDTTHGVTFTRQESYKFIAPYIVQDIWQVTADKAGGEVSGTNWNYYTNAINAVIDIDNLSIGDATPATPLGYGVQFSVGGSLYGVVADQNYVNSNSNRKRSLATQSGIAVIWPSDSSHIKLSSELNRTYTMSQFFFKSTNSLYDFALQSQLAIATAKVYTGSLWDKVCKVTGYLNTWLADDLLTPKIVASIFYPNATVMRDSFWQSFLLPSAIEQKVLVNFERNQQTSGQIPLWVHTNGTTLQLFHDESTLLYLIRAYYDRVMRGLAADQTVIKNAYNYIFTFVVNDQYTTDNTMQNRVKTWNDNFYFTPGSYNGYLQGLYCVALRCARSLGMKVSDSLLANAVTQYQALYDTTNKFIQFASDKDYISPDVLTGEALSLWLFNEKLLTDAQVNNTLAAIEKYAMTPIGAKNICDNTGAYLDSSNFIGGYSGGDYQNGASWFLYEYLAYYCGYYHSYQNSAKLINDRINQELVTDPVSHEYLITSNLVSNYPSEPTTHHVYGWNVASALIKPRRIPLTLLGLSRTAKKNRTRKTRLPSAAIRTQV